MIGSREKGWPCGRSAGAIADNIGRTIVGNAEAVRLLQIAGRGKRRRQLMVDKTRLFAGERLTLGVSITGHTPWPQSMEISVPQALVGSTESQPLLRRRFLCLI